MEEIDVMKQDSDSVWLSLESGIEEEDGEGSGRCDGGEEWVVSQCLGLPNGEVQLEE